MIPLLKAIVAVGLVAAWTRELTSNPEHWINSAQPLKLADLQGKVVWLEFGVLQ